MIDNRTETIEVSVIAVRLPKEPKPGRCWRAFSTDKGSCSGVLPDTPSRGQKLALTGQWTERNGFLSFNFRAFRYIVPVGGREQLNYAADNSPGVGPKTADRVWEEHGENWLQAFDEGKLPKLKEGVAKLRGMSALPAVLELLRPFGATSRKCEDICEHFSNPKFKRHMDFVRAPVEFIREDPYRVVQIEGIGFRWVDPIATEHMDMPFGDRRRIRAAIEYCVGSICAVSGDSIFTRFDLERELDRLNIRRADYIPCLERMIAANDLVDVGEGCLVTERQFRYENEILNYLVSGESVEMEDFEVVTAGETNVPTANQVDSVVAAASRRGFSFINGGAGCGKTSIIRMLHNSLTARGERVRLCAFAGKAAARIRDATGLHAGTMHSLLGLYPGGELPHLDGETVIVDEASMVNNELMARLVRANPKRVVLVGDEAQLPPVGEGAPFHVIVRHFPQIGTTLTKCFRARGAIHSQSLMVRSGSTPVAQHSGGEDVFICPVDNAETAQALILNAVRKGKINFDTDIIITPRNGEGEDAAPCTVNSLNRAITRIANPRAKEDGEPRLYAGDRVICTVNHQKEDVWNGTCGWLREGYAGEKVRHLVFENADKKPDEIGRCLELRQIGAKDFVHAWALTVHKSQGSQYDTVWICALTRDQFLFDNAMLYTAISRAKKRVVILADNGALQRFVKDRRWRKTWLESAISGAESRNREEAEDDE